MVTARRIPSLPGYAELHCRSNCSFLSGASQPEELVARAQALGYAALALADECSLSGVVRAHAEAERLQMRLIIGTEMQLSPAAAAKVPARTGARAAPGPRAAAGAVAGAAADITATPAPQPEPRLVLLVQSRRGYTKIGRASCRERV